MNVERVFFPDFLSSVETTARVCTDTDNKGGIEFAKKMWGLGHGTPFEHNTFRLKTKGSIQVLIKSCESLGVYQPGLRTLPGGFVGGSFRTLSALNPLKDHSFDELLSSIEWVDPLEDDARVTFKIETNIGVARQLLRHREFSFTERSTRYVKKFEIDETPSSLRKEVKVIAMQGIKEYQHLKDNGATRDEAREVLPLCTSTTFYMTGWRSSYDHFVKLRTEKHAHKGARMVGEAIKGLLGL